MQSRPPVIVPSIIRNQQQTFLRLWRRLAPHLHTDHALPLRIQELLRDHSFGSRDRRLYRELIYTALRYYPWVDALEHRSEPEAGRAVAWLAADTPATRRYRDALTDGWPPLPPTIAERAAHLGVEGGLLPEWFRPHCPAAFASPNLEVLHTRTPLWIRMQTDAPDAVLAELKGRGWTAERADIWPEAWRISGDADLPTLATFREGRFEVQDLGSQLVLGSLDLPAGGRWLDACAGAGGKTLQLARRLGPDAQVDAYDVRAQVLDELALRVRRAGLPNVRAISRPPVEAVYDGVLVDAPCSGSGTWRRAPHLKWCTTAGDVVAHAARQLDLLTRYSALVRPGGRLVYATCSLSRHENDEVVAAWLRDGAGFRLEPPARTFGADGGPRGLTLLPAQHDTDGFFVASFRRGA